MKCRWVGLILTVLSGIGVAQMVPQAGAASVHACTSILRPAVAVTFKNERGQILNAQEGRYFTPQAAKQTSVRRDSRGGWMVSVQRRWYLPVTIRGVRVVEDKCGPVRPTSITIRLKPVANAPRMREFSIFPASTDGFFVGYWPFYQRYSVFLDAPSAVSWEVTWTSSNLAVATIDQTGLLRSVCGRTPAWTTITATLKSAPTVTVSTRFGRGGSILCSRGAADR